jgi:hypothetical protein
MYAKEAWKRDLFFDIQTCAISCKRILPAFASRYANMSNEGIYMQKRRGKETYSLIFRHVPFRKRILPASASRYVFMSKEGMYICKRNVYVHRNV